jgi:hypothetical protein
MADLIFLERLQLIDHCVSLGSNPHTVHLAYYQYAEYLLKRASMLIYNSSSSSSTSSLSEEIQEQYLSLLRKAREALTIAYNTSPDQWETTLLYAVVLIQLSQEALAETILTEVLSNQLKNNNKGGNFNSLDDFSGYDSDALVQTIHPKYYIILASFFYLQNKHIDCRKALVLANR